MLGAITAVLLFATGSGPGAATQARVRLSYRVPAVARGCPSSAELRAAVAGRLGYDPFAGDAPERIEVTIAGSPEGLSANVEAIDAKGASRGARTLRSASRDCTELTNALTLAISIAIDPVALTRAAEPAAPIPAAPTVVVVQAPEPPKPPERPPTPTWFEASLVAVGAIEAAPQPSLGVAAGVALRRPRWSLGLEGRADLPTGLGYEGGSVDAYLLFGTIVPCWRPGIFGLCLLGSAGAEQGSAQGLPAIAHPSAPYVAAGARAFVDWQLARVLALTAQLDMLAPLVTTTLDVSGQPVWTTPPLTAGLALGVRFSAR